MKRIHMKKYISFGALAAAALVVVSCSKDPQSPGYEYMPDMYRSVGSESYQPSTVFANGANAQTPVDGTIPYQTDRSKMYNVMPYPYTADQYDMAATLQNPIPYSDQTLAEGKTLFNNMCAHCHGATGQGDGKIGTINPGLKPTPYNQEPLKTLPAGKIFHTITWGKGMMGPHQYIISKLDRWKIVHYVQSLQKLESAAPAAEAPKADTTGKK